MTAFNSKSGGFQLDDRRPVRHPPRSGRARGRRSAPSRRDYWEVRRPSARRTATTTALVRREFRKSDIDPDARAEPVDEPRTHEIVSACEASRAWSAETKPFHQSPPLLYDLTSSSARPTGVRLLRPHDAAARAGALTGTRSRPTRAPIRARSRGLPRHGHDTLEALRDAKPTPRSQPGCSKPMGQAQQAH
jgi:hypothetical protein